MQKAHKNFMHDVNRPISFVGLMGAGKSRIGHEVAKLMKKEFLDADHEIEQAAGLKISDIFEKYGEVYFRDGEARVIKRIVEEGGSVVFATGGGAVMRPETAQLIKDKTICVWLDTDLDVLVERT